MIEMRQLIYLDAVYRYKSFTKASKALYVSQPTISAAVRSVEQELELTLIERTPKGVVFTVEGETLMHRIRQLLSDYSDIMAEANELSHKANYTLRLGIASILSSDIFPLIYKDFLASHKDLTIRLDEDSAHGQIKKLLNEELDLAFNGLPDDLDSNKLRAAPVCKREIKLIMHRDHPLACLDRIPVERLNGEDVSMLSSSGVMGQVLEQAFADRGVQPNVVSEHSQIHGMLEIVLTCCSLGFVNLSPETVSMPKYEELELRSFQEPLSFMVGFMMKKRKYIPPVCQELIRFISERLGGGVPERGAPGDLLIP
ncbi:LysR family transcriptional regulator [Pseudoflavonifractor sp. 60]|uniref:LysR family transcriptional regulator n=1 Tax=Pseudoflavonifractor sp. 60 TaxID=2304576 RepID=UPI00136F68D2|nr:LysR family transcriptional regulator [Pseudoflavonifractor sp. 60]MCI8914540.1 LysR family transcriptional regulator [Lawsonibacter sp.]NBI68994.1 LysR family transcriptional regulator [Pseudoflavonifractor sp. 60]